ncbi:hypothetical protein CQ059_03995 [Brucella pseudogrignonensis]|nr:hypothetical protein CQ059_03995 [Brucella pseudogrignonensis]PRA42869.1 hypothetical protein CQ063_00480 [Brucella pseudogrignonensis]PRA72664.1 hypothetical protein CQ055_05105 [Brucella pseudogrignonensis]
MPEYQLSACRIRQKLSKLAGFITGYAAVENPPASALLIWVFAIHKHHLNMKVDRKKLYTARFIFNFNTLIKLHILLGKITNEI